MTKYRGIKPPAQPRTLRTVAQAQAIPANLDEGMRGHIPSDGHIDPVRPGMNLASVPKRAESAAERSPFGSVQARKPPGAKR